MGRSPERIDEECPDDIVELKRVTAKLYETSDQHGQKQVAILLERTYENSQGEMRNIKFRADLDRLEAVVDRGNELKAASQKEPERVPDRIDPKSPDSRFDYGTWTAAFYQQKDPAGKPQVVIRFEQRDTPGGDEVRQRFSCDLDHLDQVVKRAILFEHKRGHERSYHPVVKIQGLTETEGVVNVTVIGWGKRDAGGTITLGDGRDARTYAQSNWRERGYGICERAYRRPLGAKGFILTLKESDVPTLATDIAFHREERNRRAPGLLMGIWYQNGQEPIVGKPVQVLNGQDPTSREPIEYRILPPGVERPNGPGSAPITVVLDTENRSPEGWPTIKEVITDRKLAPERFQELKAEGIEQQQQRMIEQRQDPTSEDLSRLRVPKIPQ